MFVCGREDRDLLAAVSRTRIDVRLLSIRHYAITLMHGLDVRRFASATDMSFGIAIVMAMLVFGGFLISSVRRLRRMDVP